MGGTESKSDVGVTNKVINSVFQKEIQNCGVTIEQYQNTGPIIVRGDGTLSNSTISQIATVNASCLQTSDKVASLQNEITNQLQQLADANGSWMSQMLNKNVAEIKSNIANEVRNNFNSETIKNCGVAAKQTQISAGLIIEGNGKVDNFQIQQAADAYLKCTQKLSDNLSFKNALDSAVKAQTNADSSFFDFSSIVWIGIAILVFIVAVILIIRMTGGNKKVGGRQSRKKKTGGVEVLNQDEIDGYLVR
ncbi:hypothetical protein BNJ_00035 [Kaumoebavirus]|uniref:hypothetical protein n=1 Tax=Kaumoebavirus TaxID=1859492 RepID=UPI0009C3A757|nr:hypothetical protein BNJ_00035 [Kaumoebavirus]ARA71878.1 hypothetical protein BNJ_00035 [Kaumoebavirus]